MTCKLIYETMIESELDLLELDIIDFKRVSHFRNQRQALEIAAGWLKGIALVTVVEVDDFWDIPDRDDFPGWDHVGHHPKTGKQFWNWFHYHNPGSELYLGDSPDLCGILEGGSLFFGDIGMVSASAFILSVKTLSQNDIWISVSLDGTKQTVIEIVAGGREYESREAPEFYPVCPTVNAPMPSIESLPEYDTAPSRFFEPNKLYRTRRPRSITRPAYIPIRPVVWPGQCQQLSLFEENATEKPKLPKLRSKIGSGKW